MKRGLGVIRVSSADQAKDERYSIPHQKTHISSECRQRNIDLVHYVEFVQKGDRVMAKSAKERSLVMKYIKDYNIDIVIVHELDRLARSALDTLLFVDELDKLGVSFISIHDGFDTTTPQGRLQMQILAAFAEYFRKQLATKVLGGLVERAKKGLPMGKRAYGRNITPSGFETNEEEAKVIRLMAKLYLDENLGHRAIAEKLNNMGYRTQTSKMWSHQAVKDVLDNENNTSTFVWKDIRIENALEPILDIETYTKIQARRKIKAKMGGRAQNSTYLLSGLLRCSKCRGAIVGHTARKGKYVYRYYVCSEYITKGRSYCPGGWFKAELMEDSVLSDIENLRNGIPSVISSELIPSNIEDLQEQVHLKEKELERSKTMLERAASAYEAGEYDLDFFRQRKARLLELQAKLVDEIDSLHQHIEKCMTSEELTKQLALKLKNMDDIKKTSEPQKIKALLQGLIDHIEVRAKDDLTIHYRV